MNSPHTPAVQSTLIIVWRTNEVESKNSEGSAVRSNVVVISCNAVAARTKRTQIVESINAGAVAILPTHFDRIVSDTAHAFERRAGNIDKSSLRAMSLAQGARAIAAQIFLVVLARVTVVPGDPYYAARFNMVNFGWKGCCHWNNLLQFDQAVTNGGHEADPIAIHQIGSRPNVLTT